MTAGAARQSTLSVARRRMHCGCSLHFARPHWVCMQR